MEQVANVGAVSDLVIVAGHLRPKTVIIPGGDREDDIRLVESARDHGIVERCILVGNEAGIRSALAKNRIQVAPEDIIATQSPQETAERTVERVQAGGVDIILKGNISTPILNRAMLRIVVRNTISLVTVFDTVTVDGGRPMLLTDPGVTTVCSYGRLVGLIENAIDVARAILGIERPRVAILSANEKVIDSLPSTRMGAALTKREWDNAVVYGPLSLDLAVDRDSVVIKGLPTDGAIGEVAGKADILVCPGLDSANVLYKMIMENVKYGIGSFGGITVGVKLPYVILSRADNTETKLQSIALCSIAAERMSMERHQAPVHRTLAPMSGATHRVLVVNTGGDSTKVALFENEKCLHETSVEHEPLSGTPDAVRTSEGQRRQGLVNAFLSNHNIGNIDAVVASGGLLPQPEGGLQAGTYVVADVQNGTVRVDESIVTAVSEHARFWHPSNLGIPIAADLAGRFGVPAFVVDPIVIDELIPEARFSGYAGIERESIAHAVSVHAAAVRTAEKLGSPLSQTNFVIAHLGSGITIAAVSGGRIVDTNIALLGEGPFTVRRVGSLPLKGIIDLCYSGEFTREELIEELTMRGGLNSYLGEYRIPEIMARVDAGDELAVAAVDAMAYQIAKTIGSMCVAAGPNTEAIVLTGGLAGFTYVVKQLKQRLTHLLPVLVLKTTPDMEAMALGACRVLAGEEDARHYELPPGLQ